MRGHVMTSFPHTLVGLGPFADQGCRIVFAREDVAIIDTTGRCILKGWREKGGARLWQFPLTAPTAAPSSQEILPTWPVVDSYL